MYVEKKKIYGKIYYYLKISARKGTKIKTKTISYLGKEPMTKKDIKKKIADIPKKKIISAKKELDESFEDAPIKFLNPKQIKKVEDIKTDFSKKLKLNKKLVEDMFKDFKTSYIYNTNTIEGNTLTLEETNLLLNENRTPENKDVREIYDHINEKEVFDYLLKEKPEINKDLIIDIHSRLLRNIDKRIGNFRRHNVRVLGATFETSDAKYVQIDLNLLLKWYNKNKKTLNSLILAAIFHEKFERIHPFYDGNGRTGRMLVNLILQKNKLPPLIIKNKDRKRYFQALSSGHKADLTKIDDCYKDIVEFFYEQIIDTYNNLFARWG